MNLSVRRLTRNSTTLGWTLAALLGLPDALRANVSLVSTEQAIGGWDIARRSDSSFDLLWSESPVVSPASIQMWLRRFDSAGTPLAPAIAIVPPSGLQSFRLVNDSLDNELVVLKLGQGSPSNPRYSVRVFGLSAGGAELWPSRLIAETTEPGDFIGSVGAVAAPGDGWIVVWDEYHAAASPQFEPFSIHVALADGTATPRTSLGSPAQNLTSLSVASDGAHPLAVWREAIGLEDSRVLGRSLDGNGVPTGAAVDLAHLDSPDLYFGGIGVDAVDTGNYFISWTQAGSSGPTDTLGLSYFPGAPPLAPVGLVHEPGIPSIFAFAPSVAVDRQGRAMIAWIESPPGASYPTTVVRQGRRVTGEALSEIVTLATYAGFTFPGVMITDDGAWIATWTRGPAPVPALGGIIAEFGSFQNGCENSEAALCLAGNRFRATATFHDYLGHDGIGHAVALTPESGTFWFYTPANVELILKVVDACGHPDFRDFWVYAAGLTDVEVTLTVIDTWTGATWERSTSLGEPFPVTLDSGAFHTCDATPVAGPFARSTSGTELRPRSRSIER